MGHTMPKKGEPQPNLRIVEDIQTAPANGGFELTIEFSKPVRLKKGTVDELADGLHVRYRETQLSISEPWEVGNNGKTWRVNATFPKKLKKVTAQDEINTDEIIVVIETKKPVKPATAKNAEKTASSISKKKAAKKKVKKKAAKKSGTK